MSKCKENSQCNYLKNLSIAVSAGMVIGVASIPVASAGSNPFIANDLNHGTVLAASHGDGSCGEGKCGGDKDKKKGGEGKCGEGKCGS